MPGVQEREAIFQTKYISYQRISKVSGHTSGFRTNRFEACVDKGRMSQGSNSSVAGGKSNDGLLAAIGWRDETGLLIILLHPRLSLHYLTIVPRL